MLDAAGGPRRLGVPNGRSHHTEWPVGRAPYDLTFAKRRTAAISSSSFSSACGPSPFTAPATQCRTWASSTFSGDLFERGLDGRDLGQDVDAVGVLVDHPLEAADLALDAAEAIVDGAGIGLHAGT